MSQLAHAAIGDRRIRETKFLQIAQVALCQEAKVVVGDWAGRSITEAQPVKLASVEGVAHTERGAAFTIGGIYDAKRQRVRYGIRIPKLLSLLARHDPNARVVGLDAVPPQDRPPVNVVRFAFQTMVGIGTLLAALSVLYFAALIRWRRIPDWVWFHRGLVVHSCASWRASVGSTVTCLIVGLTPIFRRREA